MYRMDKQLEKLGFGSNLLLFIVICSAVAFCLHYYEVPLSMLVFIKDMN